MADNAKALFVYGQIALSLGGNPGYLKPYSIQLFTDIGNLLFHGYQPAAGEIPDISGQEKHLAAFESSGCFHIVGQQVLLIGHRSLDAGSPVNDEQIIRIDLPQRRHLRSRLVARVTLPECPVRGRFPNYPYPR